MFVLCTSAVSAGQFSGPVRLEVHTEARSVTVASYRLQRYLDTQNCKVELVFNQAGESEGEGQGEGQSESDLVYRQDGLADRLKLRAVNADGQDPVPVWVTRKTAGVRTLGELEGRDVSLVAGTDPLSGRLALEALAAEGVTPKRGQRYEAGDFSSALGLLLHNNTHAAVSELGLVTPFLESQGLAITWQGEPVSGAGWYAGTDTTNPGLQPCLKALLELKLSDDRQIFNLFPEWVHGFAPPDSLQ
nr:PhnD/SsuA/transferrin family substrate-binding protein [Marinobacter sp. G11]